MKSRIICITVFACILVLAGCSIKSKIEVSSPDGNITMSFSATNGGEVNSPIMTFTLTSGNKRVLEPSALRLFSEPLDLGGGFTVTGTTTESVQSTWTNQFGERKEVPDHYNQVKLFLERGDIKLNLICRVYNEGAAFSFEIPEQSAHDSIVITDEYISFRFPGDYPAWSTPRPQGAYSKVPLSKIDTGCERPLVIEYDTALTIALTEAKMVDYAAMTFDPDTASGISVRTRLGGEVHKSLPFQSPWRVIMVGENPGDLLEKNYLILNLNDPCAITDVSWITPGKVLRETTLTTVGAKAAIDFTSSHNMQYILFDAGWYGQERDPESDPTTVTVDPARSKGPLDLYEVIDHAHKKNIRILLYVNRIFLEQQLDELLPLYKEWGISGIKFGFVRVGTQDATHWLHESIRKLASYEMVINVHDKYRPTGFSRTCPNFLTMEGIRGDEESPSNHHTLITMFTRMVAGRGDNTICYFNERVPRMGSHASQLAKAVCLFSPLQVIYWYDRAIPPPAGRIWGYLGDEPELEFFDNVPTVWDETKVLYAKIGEYGVIARKKGEEWFIGGINNEHARTLHIKMSFLDPGMKYRASVYTDDHSVDTRTHVRIDRIEADNRTDYTAELGSNEGIAMHIVPSKQIQ